MRKFISGTRGNDIIRDTGSNDSLIQGVKGTDVIYAGGGSDRILASGTVFRADEDGNDYGRIFAGKGRDRVEVATNGETFVNLGGDRDQDTLRFVDNGPLRLEGHVTVRNFRDEDRLNFSESDRSKVAAVEQVGDDVFVLIDRNGFTPGGRNDVEDFTDIVGGRAGAYTLQFQRSDLEDIVDALDDAGIGRTDNYRENFYSDLLDFA